MRTTPTPSPVFAAGLSGTMSPRRAAGTVAISEHSVQVFVCSMHFPTCSLKSLEAGQKVEPAHKIDRVLL
jgi:hypothetical protein